MTVPGALPPDLFTALAALFLLLGVPLILFALIMLYTGYVRYDAEQYLEELEGERERSAHGGEVELGAHGEEEGAAAERSESAATRDERRAERHSPATSEEGETEESDDESTGSGGGDEPKSP